MNDIVTNEINELKDKISRFKAGLIVEDKFKHYRLTRGVYGQRQPGVQMIRIKLAFGRLNPEQIRTLAKLSNEYADGNLHLTTRQNIQLHYVRLENSPKVWEGLAKVGLTTRESCGNTVRGITASPIAGVDPRELFDVSPYADQVYRYFLRNPICQSMGRKFKIAFSSNDQDTAFAYIHDLGFIPTIKKRNNQDEPGFRVFLGGGLGAQPYEAHQVKDFLPLNELLPFSEAVIRAFDRYGERKNRNKARLKFLLNKMGVEVFLEHVEKEKKALKSNDKKIQNDISTFAYPSTTGEDIVATGEENPQFKEWLKTNTFEQKQKGFYGAYLKIQNGDIDYLTALKLADVIEEHSLEEARITVDQNLLIRFVPQNKLYSLYQALQPLNLAAAGYGSVHDVTTCPGTDTCNLAVTNSTALGRALEQLLSEKYNDLIFETRLKIKISGCMNSCGQHMVAGIGFHGSSIKDGSRVIPATQLVLGGGATDNGAGRMADRVIKVPTKKAPLALELLLDDYAREKAATESFMTYYLRKGKIYFYDLLKHLTDKSKLTATDYVDWAATAKEYKPEIGTGECAGVIVDTVDSILQEGQEQYALAEQAFEEKGWADGIYHLYNFFVVSAKGMLLTIGKETNTQTDILKTFEEHKEQFGIHWETSFETQVLQISSNTADEHFAHTYLTLARAFCIEVKAFQVKRAKETTREQIVDHYKA